MISESYYWKNDLLKQAKFIEAKIAQKRYTIASWSRLEQSVLLGFYSIRKLIESKKLTDKVVGENLSVQFYESSKTDEINHMNWHQLDRHYALDKDTKRSFSLKYIANQLIHSYVLLPIWSEDEKHIQGIAFNSDKTKKKVLYIVDLKDVVKIFNIVGNDYPTESVWTRNDNGEFEIENK
jgi:hypothetical protein